MYIAKHFELTTEQIADLLANATTAQVVGGYPEGPEATILPISYVPDAGGGLGSILAHVTRTNPLWKREPIGDLLAIVSGPDAYISPTWFPSYPTAPEVPTWNYLTVHAYGRLIVHDDAEWCRAAVAELSASHGYDVAQVSDRSMELMLRSIVGIELELTRVLGKAKMSQNKSSVFIEGVTAGLRERSEGLDADVADAMDAISLPQALAREAMVEGIRAEHLLGHPVASDQS